ncbi:MAG: nitroreductase family deazaflavin-dependent oxidoreductase [Candidatus Odinarchaeota archaeon]
MVQDGNRNGTNELSGDLPRPGSLFHSMLKDEKSKKRYIRLFRLFNLIMIPLYKLRLLPLFGLGRRMLVITVKGRKSGKKRNNPVEYFRINGIIHVFAGFGKYADWFKNMVANPNDIYIQAGFRKFHARIKILDEEEAKEICRWIVKNHPRYSKSGFGWDSKHDDPETADFTFLANAMKIIQLHKRNEGK